MLRDPRTQTELTKLRERAAERAVTTLAEWLATELKITRFDPAWLFDEDGNLLSLQEVEPDARAAIQSIVLEEECVEALSSGSKPIVRRTRIMRIRLHSKDRAQARLARFLGAYDRVNQQQNSIEPLFGMLLGDMLAQFEKARRASFDTVQVGPTSVNRYEPDTISGAAKQQ